jgi:hypothetical protein
MSADFYSLEMDSSNYFPLSRSMDSPGQTVSLKSEKFEMELAVWLRPQRSQMDIPYHFKKGMVCQF